MRNMEQLLAVHLVLVCYDFIELLYIFIKNLFFQGKEPNSFSSLLAQKIFPYIFAHFHVCLVCLYPVLHWELKPTCSIQYVSLLWIY